MLVTSKQGTRTRAGPIARQTLHTRLSANSGPEASTIEKFATNRADKPLAQYDSSQRGVAEGVTLSACPARSRASIMVPHTTSFKGLRVLLLLHLSCWELPFSPP